MSFKASWDLRVGAEGLRTGSVSLKRSKKYQSCTYFGFRAFFRLGLPLVAAMLVAAGGCATESDSGRDDASAVIYPSLETWGMSRDDSFVADKTEIRGLLATQAEAWNRRDLVGFMAGYWESEHLVFMTKEGTTRGHAETLARYRKSYDTPEKFGWLAFEELDVSPVDHETAVVRGVWRLKERKGEPHGRFVLIVRRFPEGWKVVSDYTTSA